MAADAERYAAWLDDGIDVYAYFNNDWYGHAVTDAHRPASATSPSGRPSMSAV